MTVWFILVCIVLLAGLVRERYLRIRSEHHIEKVQAVTSNDQHLVHLIEDSKDVVYYFQIEPEYKFIYLSQALDTFLGKGTRIAGLKNPHIPFNLVHPDDRELLFKKVSNEVNYDEVLMQRWIDQNGDYRWFEEYASPVYENGKFVAVQGIMRNIDEKIKLQQDLEYRVSHDALTGLHNRAYFDEQFDELNEYVNIPAGIIVGDLDNLKQVNDRDGHKTGDALLIATATLLQRFTSDTVLVSRNGGDEFVLLVTGNESLSLPSFIASINEEIENYNRVASTAEVHLSIGYAVSTSSLGNMKQLFIEADKNMYKNKEVRKEEKGICV
ncbi:sensor domain-containing diguanylate cyclase [Sporosarcina sp. A2]|uniref:sensor domain-containing diguanylate cyclase n=1 Tax=Sporosarcina sp. A2 TaxID=3393449 RepID=UPI003D78E1A9